MNSDRFQLQRFLEAQAPVFPVVLAELQSGRKRTHWMWFVFPQLAGLGHSAMAERYAITSRAEAEAFLAHPELGPRLRDCTGLALLYANRSLYEIFGTPDDLKFRSSMTLFDHVSPGDIFAKSLKTLCKNERDAKTLSLLENASDGL